MKITKRQLIELIRETSGEMRSQEAIANAQKTVRPDGLSFEDFITTLLDYLEDKTDQQWSEEMLSDDWNYYDEWIKGEDPYSIAAEYLADSYSYMRENKMKITKRQLRRIIREATRQDDWAAKEKEIAEFAGFQQLKSFKLPYRGSGYAGRRIISRDRAWLEFVPRGSDPLTREDMFRAVTLLDIGDPEISKALQQGAPKSAGPVENYDVYSVYATTTG